MKEINIYLLARNNEALPLREYSKKEIREIVSAQFHYFWYNVNLRKQLEKCSYNCLEEKTLNKIKIELELFKEKNKPVFKNQIRLFEITLLHLLLNTVKKEEKGIVKI